MAVGEKMKNEDLREKNFKRKGKKLICSPGRERGNDQNTQYLHNPAIVP